MRYIKMNPYCRDGVNPADYSGQGIITMPVVMLNSMQID